MQGPELLYILIAGFILISTVSLFIARQVGKHINSKIAAWTHLAIAGFVCYYLIDSIEQSEWKYCVFWGIVILSQGIWFFLSWHKIERSTTL